MTAIDLFSVRRSVSEPSPGHLAPSISPFDPRVVKPSYALGEVLPGGETQTIEFKSCVQRQSSAECGSEEEHAIMTIKTKVGRYISAFLNSSGGCILFGIEDDGTVTGVGVNERLRVQTVKAIDNAVGVLDPQVEVNMVTHCFAPVTSAEGDGHGDGVVEDLPHACGRGSHSVAAGLSVVLVMVQPSEVRRQQPVYYLNPSSLEAWIRRHESLHRMDATLINQREAEFAEATGRSVARTWRHLILRAVPFEEHTEELLDAQQQCGAKVTRLWVFERIVQVILSEVQPPPGQLVCVLGQAGCGKSTLMAALMTNGTQRRPETDADGWRFLGVLGCHYCVAGAPQTLSARAFVDAFAAALVISTYSRSFKQRAIDRPIEVLRVCDVADPVVAFRGLLRLCKKLPNRQRRIVVSHIAILPPPSELTQPHSPRCLGSLLPPADIRSPLTARST